MIKEASSEHVCYVLYSDFNDDVDGKRVLIFIGEFDDEANAEQKKAELNREMPVQIRDVTAKVGLAHFHPHPEDENKDFILVTPKDGSKAFLWGQMLDMKEITRLYSEVK